MKKCFTLFILPVFFLLSVLSCKKDPVTPEPEPEPEVPTPTVKTYQQLLADTLFKLAQQVYYWNSHLSDSASFKPLGYAGSDTLTGLKNELFALTQLPINSVTGKPYEFYQYTSSGTTVTTSKYSYIKKTADLYDGGASSYSITNQSDIAEMKMTLDGKDNGLGFTVGLIPVRYSAINTKDSIVYKNRDSTVIYVRNVTNGSPAYEAGLRRGDIIANKELNYNTYGVTPISNLLDGNSAKLVLYRIKANKMDTLQTINKAVYTFNPVLNDTLVTIGSKKIAYVAYQSFTTGTNSKPALDSAFNKFTGATDIVVDLRFNGGGYVSMAAYLINLLAPSSSNGSVAFAEYYNQTMINKQATLLKQQPIFINNVKQSYTYFDVDYSVSGNTSKVNKTSGVNMNNSITNIYFIVSSSTASAAELVINSLKPYYNVILIGAQFSDYGYNTYGKPIGFFELRLGKYSVYLSNFETKNAQGSGGYYAGISTNYQIFDDIRYNFGDPNELCFLSAIRLITGNSTYLPTVSSTVGRSVYGTNTQGLKGIAVGKTTQIRNMITTPTQ
ncbi:MAG: S41 family peptidase [Niabella sp.]